MVMYDHKKNKQKNDKNPPNRWEILKKAVPIHKTIPIKKAATCNETDSGFDFCLKTDK